MFARGVDTLDMLIDFTLSHFVVAFYRSRFQCLPFHIVAITAYHEKTLYTVQPLYTAVVLPSYRKTIKRTCQFPWSTH